jgi:hypothetical protein
MLESALGLNFFVDVAETDGLRRLLCRRRRHGGMVRGVEVN